MASRDYLKIAREMLTAAGSPYEGKDVPPDEVESFAHRLADSDLEREGKRSKGLRCSDPRCENHEDTGDNMRFRGVQEFHPQTLGEAATGAERRKKGGEHYFCYACGKEALGSLDGTDDEVDALLPAPPLRPLKGGENPPGSES